MTDPNDPPVQGEPPKPGGGQRLVAPAPIPRVSLWQRATSSAERRAVLASLGFLAVGLVVVWVTTRLIEAEGDALVIALLALPLLAYLAVSGRLEEITGPGDFSAKFKTEAERPVRALEEPVEVEVPGEMVKGRASRIRERVQEASVGPGPKVLIIELGQPRFTVRAMRQHVDALNAAGRFSLALFVNAEGRLVLHLEGSRFSPAIHGDHSEALVRAINESDVETLKAGFGALAASIPEGTANIAALDECANRGVQALPIVDASGRVKGVVESQRVIADLFRAAAHRPPKPATE